jgi:hypothetical protein
LSALTYSSGVSEDSARWADLVSEMYAVVYEEWPLHSVTQGAIDDLGGGRTTVHGPWLPEECQSVLIPWQDVGWLELVADAEPPPGWNLRPADWQARAVRRGAFVLLSNEDARELLHQPGRWTVETADGQVMPCRTEEGDRHTFDEWLSLAEAARNRL